MQTFEEVFGQNAGLSAPAESVYYDLGPAEYGKQLAQYQYRQGNLNAGYNDPTYGHVTIASLLTPTDTGPLAGFSKRVLDTPSSFNKAEGGYNVSPDIQTTSSNPTAQVLPPARISPIPGPAPVEDAFAGYRGGNANTSSIVDYLSSVGKPTDFTSRSVLAKQLGIQNYTGSAQQNTQLLSTLRAGATPSAPVSTSITPEAMKSVTPVTVPSASTGTTDSANALVAGAGTNLSEIMKQITPAETPEQQQQQGILDKMTSLVGQEGQKAADQLTAEQSANLPQFRQQFADINAQILAKTAEYNVLQTENQNKPITMNSIIGNERAILNAKAADIGLLQAKAQGLQGQIATAQETVNRAIDLKYSTIEAQLNTYQAQLNALKPTLDRQEKIRADAQQILIDQQKQKLADAKQAEKDQQNYVYNQMAKYGDAGILPTDSFATIQQKIKGSRIYQEAIRMIGGNTPTPTPGDQNGKTIPSQLQPYSETAGNGNRYVDLSGVTGKTRDSLTQLAGQNGIKVIFDKNTAADLKNIQNAYSNLDTILAVVNPENSPSALSRLFYGIGASKLAQTFQTNPQKAAAGALNDASLDILKAISGVQGFRGNQSAIEQIKENLPSIYDTQSTAQQKIANVKQLIQNREDALVGKATNSTTTSRPPLNSFEQ